MDAAFQRETGLARQVSGCSRTSSHAAANSNNPCVRLYCCSRSVCSRQAPARFKMYHAYLTSKFASSSGVPSHAASGQRPYRRVSGSSVTVTPNPRRRTAQGRPVSSNPRQSPHLVAHSSHQHVIERIRLVSGVHRKSGDGRFYGFLRGFASTDVVLWMRLLLTCSRTLSEGVCATCTS